MFPNYQVLSHLKKTYSIGELCNDIFIISVQHLLESTGSLFESFIQVGIRPDYIFLTGKLYSTHLKTQQKLKALGVNVIESTVPKELGVYSESLEKDICKMWQLLSQKLTPNSKIIILDDGGYTLKNVPDDILESYAVYGIEQTTSGIRMQSAFGKFPVIHLAASAAKVIIEPPIVSEAVKIQIGRSIEELQPHKVGIVGYGYIGKAVVNEFKDKYSIIVYDKNNGITKNDNAGITFTGSLQELYDVCDVIVSATGQDISELSWLKKVNGNKTLISISSGDVEFNKLLRACTPYLVGNLTNPLQDLLLKTESGHSLRILRGGMVANFTGTPDSSPGQIIQVTRGLLLSAVIQVVRDNDLLKEFSGPIMLDPLLQSDVVQTWFNDQPQRKNDYTPEILNGFKSPDWIKQHSAGQFVGI